MKKMFWGLLFLFIDINLGRLCVTPAWVGYLLIWSGLGEVPESKVFQNIRSLTVGAAIFTGLMWLKQLLNVTIAMAVIEVALTIAGVCLQLLVTYRIVEGVRELEAVYNRDMRSAGLLAGWKDMLGGIIVAYALIFFVPGLALAGLVLTFAAAIYYAVAFWEAAQAYREAAMGQ